MAVQQDDRKQCQGLVAPSTVNAIKRQDEGNNNNNDSGYFSPSPVVSVETTKRLHLPCKNDSDGSVITPMRRPSMATGCLVEKPSTRRAVTLSGDRIVSPHLIGYFVGRQQVDIICELTTLNLGHVASNVAHSLAPAELHVACQVSRTWRTACLADPRDRKRLKTYLLQRKQDKENTSATDTKLKQNVERDHEPLMLLCDSQNRLPNVAAGPSVPKDMARFMRFTEEAKKLDAFQKLDKCPRCASPAQVIPQQSSAECRSINGCGLIYCIHCRCERRPIDGRHVCDSLSPPRPAEPATHKSRQERKALARKNLRRLLS